MRMKKPLLIAGTVAGISLAGVGGMGMASAATSTDSQASNPMSGLVDKIASKFNLDKTQVQAVFDEEHTAREAERQKQIETKLSEAVTAGKLTEAQKSAILAKQKEMKAEMDANRDAMKNKTEAERKADMKAKRTELENWAKQNNIPTQYQRYVMGGHGHGGPRPDDDQQSN